MFKNALVSLSNKVGLVEFLTPLIKNGLRVIATDGTASYLKQHGLAVTAVSEQTGFPEVMDGRVRTLHPYVHMCLLARSDKPEDMEILKQHKLEPFDLVIGNLYPFEQAQSQNLPEYEMIEYIDVGGPAILRAAAKNFDRITVVCDPKDYEWISDKKEITLADRKKLASKVFSHVSSYDAAIASYMNQEPEALDWVLGARFVTDLRYGENPHQKGAWYRFKGDNQGLHTAQILQGKPLSFNNILDLEAATATVREFPTFKACVGVKHNNPCAVAQDDTIEEATVKALKADPVSIFGGVVALNSNVDESTAQLLSNIFLECVIAPGFTDDALTIFKKKSNLRVLRWQKLMSDSKYLEMRSVAGGVLTQTHDKVGEWNPEWKIMGEKPQGQVLQDLLMAWKVAAHLKSNAIAITFAAQTVGLGMGQVNRVDAVEQAIGRMKKFHPGIANPVLASDAFFPFPDSIELIAKAGIKWVIQPGGSIKDEEVFSRAKELGVNLVITGQRHFRH